MGREIGKAILAAAAVGSVLTGAWAQSNVVYFNDFNGRVGSSYREWSSSSIHYTNVATSLSGTLPAPPVTNTQSPNKSHVFLGEFGGPAIGKPGTPGWNRTRVEQTVTLTLTNLPEHDTLELEFDLLILKSWDGNSPIYGTDRWRLEADGAELLYTSFSNNPKTEREGSNQNYPLPRSAPQAGAVSTNTLGYKFFGDSIYHLKFTFPHEGSRLRLDFNSSLFEGKGTADESWGLDNVRLATAASLVDRRAWYVDAERLERSQAYTLRSVQALANVSGPKLFLVGRAPDRLWLRAMEKQLGRSLTRMEPEEALKTFATNAPQVIYDAKQPWTISIATTLAGIHHAILTARDLGRPIAFDCRERWASKLEGYRWAMKELLPKCNQRLLVYLDDGLPFFRDFAIQRRAFVVNLDPLNNDGEIRFLQDMLKQYPSQTRVFGWASGAYARKARGQTDVNIENALVSRLSMSGKVLVPSDFDDNLSFYSKVPVATLGDLKQEPNQREIRFEPGKRYVLLVVSDGDNLQYDTGAMREHWKEADRPKIPLAWTISSQWAEVGPAVLASYYREAAERGGWDEFVAGPSGYGYVNPGSMPRAQLAEFVRLTRQFCDRADLRSLTILDVPSRPGNQVAAFLATYASAGFDGLWLAAMPKYVGAIGRTAFLNERFRLGGGNQREIARQVNECNEPFILIYVSGWEIGAAMLREFVAGLNDSCVLVSSSEMAEMLRQWQSGTGPTSAYSNARLLSATPAASQGLKPVSVPDGAFTIVEREGAQCWHVGQEGTPQYLYFDVDDGFHPLVGTLLEVELEYFDSGSKDIILEYDSANLSEPFGGAYRHHPGVVHGANTQQWQTARFRMNDARFRGSQNGQADFRFYNGGDELLVKAVRVKRL